MESGSETEATSCRSEAPFSLEIITEILFHLDPVDIARMRQACHVFRKAANARLVWKSALERVIEEHGIFSPTFPLDVMSTKQLEHAASGPYRFTDKIQTGFGDRYRAYQDRTFSPLQKNHLGTYVVERMTLVPGGRFLVTSGDESICLWDLGFSLETPINPYPLATLEGNGFKLEDVSPSPSDDNELILAVTSKENDVDVLTIYAIDLMYEEPEFEEKGKFKFPSQDLTNVFFLNGTPEGDGRFNSAHLNQEYAFIYCQPFFVVWDWVKDTAARWSLDDPLQKIFVCDKAIMTCDIRGAFGVFDSPWWLKPVPNNDCSQMHSVRLNPRGFFGQPSQTPARINFVGSPTWQQRIGANPYLCLLNDGKPGGRDPVMYLYSIRRIGKPLADDYLPSCLPAGAGISWTAYGTGVDTRYHGGASSLFQCAQRLVMCTRSKKSTFVATSLSQPRESSRNSIVPVSAILTAPVKFPEGPHTGKQFGFCPMSGRLIYPVVREDGGEGPETEIHVCDYLLPLQFQGQVDSF